MSTLLEKAIIDAKALKEAAMKNAENLVIEKYSQEVKEAMKSLLEEEDPFAMDFDLGDDLGGEESAGDDLGGDDLGADTPSEETDAEEKTDDGPSEEEIQAFADSTVGQVPSAFDPDIADPDDEIVDIKLDSLKFDTPEEEVTPFAGGDELGDDEIGIDVGGLDLDDEEDEDLDLDLDDDEDFDLDFDSDFDSDFGETDPEPIGVDITTDTIAEVIHEMGVDPAEVDMEGLLERVRVDFEPQKSGWAGTPESIMREYEEMLLAREQDSEIKERNEELRDTVAKLQKENKTLTSVATKLKAQNEKYTTTLLNLQEKLETSNVSNAKLLYINRALENASLNERQKRKIVESISKAETVQEAKIVFETLHDAAPTSPAERKMTSLSEAISRKSTLLVAAREEQKQKVANPLFDRMQMLAGIKQQ